MRYGELCAQLRRKMHDSGEDNTEFVARELVAFSAGKSLAEYLRDKDLLAPASVQEKAERLLDEYLKGRPLAYILGEWSFFGVPLKVSEKVLIPRDDTMAVAELALEKCMLFAKPRVLDLCTGSGCIGIALAMEHPASAVTLADISEDALQIAAENVRSCGLDQRVSVAKADALQAVPPFLGKFDIIVSNPPYITAAEMPNLERSVRDFEPHLALFGGEDGLDFYRAICKNYANALAEGGYLIFEFGRGQETAVEEILLKSNFEDLEFKTDTSNIIRAVSARKKGKE